jgi:hypothetical protein
MSATPHDIVLITIARPGIDGTGITPAEKAQLVTDVATALARPAITKLTDISDVEDGASVGETIVWDGTNWAPGQPVGSIGAVYDHTDTQVITEATSITAKGGLTARAGTGAGAAVIEALIGTAANTLAEGNHTHTLKTDHLFPYPESGALSSGTRTLVSGNVTGLDPERTYVLKGTLTGDVQGGGTGAGYSTPRITIHSNTKARFGRVRSVAGVPREFTVHHGGVTVSGVSSATVSADIQYSEGDPINVGGGVLRIEIEANR